MAKKLAFTVVFPILIQNIFPCMDEGSPETEDLPD